MVVSRDSGGYVGVQWITDSRLKSKGPVRVYWWTKARWKTGKGSLYGFQ